MVDALFSEDDRMFGSSSDVPPPNEGNQPQPEPARQPEPPKDGPPRDEVGRFAPKQPEPAAAAPVPASPAPIAPTPAKPSVDPEQFKGYLDEREKRQAADARVKKLEEQLAERNRKPVEIPSIQTDPEAYHQHIQNEITEARIYERTVFSEVLAKEKYGDAVVQAAEDWGLQQMQTVPGFRDRHRAEAHPIDWLVKQFKRNEVMGKIGDDPDAWVRARYAELTAAPQTNEPQAPAPVSNQPAAHAPQQPANPPPPRSLASAPSAGGLNTVVPTGEFAALDDMFGKK